VEPFAGAAGYSLRYASRRIVLVDASPIICGVWRYLIRTSAAEIRRLPDIPDAGTVDDLAVPQEARWLIGFWCNAGCVTPCKSPSKWARDYPNKNGWTFGKERVASQVDQIRHWQVFEGDYTTAPNIRATWHIDPPYSTPAGRHYPHQPASFDDLGKWCRTRQGQVMVCEQAGAAWLPFRQLGAFRSGSGRTVPTKEVIWTKSDAPALFAEAK
jgi:hypothetical protein